MIKMKDFDFRDKMGTEKKIRCWNFKKINCCWILMFLTITPVCGKESPTKRHLDTFSGSWPTKSPILSSRNEHLKREHADAFFPASIGSIWSTIVESSKTPAVAALGASNTNHFHSVLPVEYVATVFKWCNKSSSGSRCRDGTGTARSDCSTASDHLLIAIRTSLWTRTASSLTLCMFCSICCSEEIHPSKWLLNVTSSNSSLHCFIMVAPSSMACMTTHVLA